MSSINEFIRSAKPNQAQKNVTKRKLITEMKEHVIVPRLRETDKNPKKQRKIHNSSSSRPSQELHPLLKETLEGSDEEDFQALNCHESEDDDNAPDPEDSQSQYRTGSRESPQQPVIESIPVARPQKRQLTLASIASTLSSIQRPVSNSSTAPRQSSSSHLGSRITPPQPANEPTQPAVMNIPEVQPRRAVDQQSYRLQSRLLHNGGILVGRCPLCTYSGGHGSSVDDFIQRIMAAINEKIIPVENIIQAAENYWFDIYDHTTDQRVLDIDWHRDLDVVEFRHHCRFLDKIQAILDLESNRTRFHEFAHVTDRVARIIGGIDQSQLTDRKSITDYFRLIGYQGLALKTVKSLQDS